MNEIISFVFIHKHFSFMLICTNILLGIFFSQRLRLFTDRMLIEASGERNNSRSIYKKCTLLVSRSISEYERAGNKSEFYTKAEIKMKRAGYKGKYAAATYLILKYAATGILFILALALNYPSIKEAIIASAAAWLVINLVVGSRKKRFSLVLQKNIYKIYKFLHNQISSGVRVTDAIKSVYEIVDNEDLREVMVKLAARYELTLDIDASLDEFKSYFDLQEVETLCVALKQGVLTGDNQEILARQEDIMFKKYFNFIQAETDNCKVRSIVAATLFVAIIVIMISVPLFIDAANALGKIFVN